MNALTAYYLMLFVGVSLVVGFLLVISQIHRRTCGTPTPRRVRKLMIAFLLFGIAGLACGVGFSMLLKYYGPAGLPRAYFARRYLERHYGATTNSGLIIYPPSSLKQLEVRVDPNKPSAGYFVYSFSYGIHSGILTSMFHRAHVWSKDTYDFVIVESQ